MNDRMRSRKGTTTLLIVFMLVMVLTALLSMFAVGIGSFALTSRSVDVSEQNRLVSERLERASSEALQSIYGVSATPASSSLSARLTEVLANIGSGDVSTLVTSVPASIEIPLSYPQVAGLPPALATPSAELLAMADPSLRQWMGDLVLEGATSSIDFTMSRPAIVGTAINTHPVRVSSKAVSIPVTRWGVFPYDLPTEIGESTGAVLAIPAAIPANRVAPQGLHKSRDEARIAQLESGSNRPGHYRRLAAASEAIQALFTQASVQFLSDYAGVTHWVQIGRGGANPSIQGGAESGSTYTLDVGQLGLGTFGPHTATKEVIVIFGATGSDRVVLTDSTGGTSAVVVLLVGPALAATGHLEVSVASSISRPVIIRGYNVAVRDLGGKTINGGLILDPLSSFDAAGGLFNVGSLVFWAGSSSSLANVRVGAMPAAAQRLAPRIILFATERTFP